MWADRVDQWLDQNSVKGGHSSISAPNRLFVFPLLRFSIHILTFGISFILMWLLRDKSLFYSEQIRNRINPHFNLDNEGAKNRIKSIFTEEMAELGESEKVLFLIEDEKLEEHGMVLTNQRLIYRLTKQGLLIESSTSGQVPIKDLTKNMKATEFADTTIRIDNKPIGTLHNESGYLIDNFLNVICKSLQNEEILKSHDSSVDEITDSVNGQKSNEHSPIAEETPLPEMKSDPWATYTLLIVIWGLCFAIFLEVFGFSIEDSAIYGTILSIVILFILSIVLTKAFMWFAVIFGIISIGAIFLV